MDPQRPEAAAVVVAADEQDDVPLDLERWTTLATEVLGAEGVVNTEVSLTFVDQATIAGLNQAHLDGDGGPTDVLAFPIDPYGERYVVGVPRMLGDVVICPAVAQRQAPEHAGTLDAELALLLIHGLLHLLGMDHADPRGRQEMQDKEAVLLAKVARVELDRDPWLEP
ncbi:MAG: rRNA maturation RNase YbeY [Actinobacteria bacterium]|nr:rRNA maturation RNase YbeY [Actinomycetota bacterium]